MNLTALVEVDGWEWDRREGHGMDQKTNLEEQNKICLLGICGCDTGVATNPISKSKIRQMDHG
jgi:hypothetical protein